MLQSIDLRILKGMGAIKTARLVRQGARRKQIVRMAAREIPPYELISLLRELKDSDSAGILFIDLEAAADDERMFQRLLQEDLRAFLTIFHPKKRRRYFRPSFMDVMRMLRRRWQAYQLVRLANRYDEKYRDDLAKIAFS